MQSALQIENLRICFYKKGNPIFEIGDITISLGKGKVLGLIGESGSGKSATALSILRLLPRQGVVEGGRVLYLHDDVVDLLTLSNSRMRQYRGKQISMIFQEPMSALNPVLTCGYQMDEMIRCHLKLDRSEAKSRTLKLFSDVKLDEVERIYHAYPHTLSGGQKQRVLIAMALSCNPSILIADEPTTSIDVTTQASILELLQHLRKNHDLSMIYISHDLAVISGIADWIGVMRNGKMVETGKVKEIFNSPKHAYTKALLACRPPINMHLRRMPELKDFLNDHSVIHQQPQVEVKEIWEHLKLSNEEIASRKIQLKRSEALLQVNNLSVDFDGDNILFQNSKHKKRAVNGVTFNIIKGETMGLVGESGCGKTSLGRAILRLINYSEGQVYFKGKDLAGCGTDSLRSMRKNLQIVFQDPYSSLNPRISCGEAILEPLIVHNLFPDINERKEKVIGMLNKVGLSEDSFNHFPHEFSGGQRQRICIARALITNPEFIIFDECVSALDVSVQAQVLNLLMQLREEFGFTSLFISHDFSVVKFISDRLMVMKDGCIEEIGNTEDVFSNPQSAYTRKLIDSIPQIRYGNN